MFLCNLYICGNIWTHYSWCGGTNRKRSLFILKTALAAMRDMLTANFCAYNVISKIVSPICTGDTNSGEDGSWWIFLEEVSEILLSKCADAWFQQIHDECWEFGKNRIFGSCFIFSRTIPKERGPYCSTIITDDAECVAQIHAQLHVKYGEKIDVPGGRKQASS